MATEKKKPAPAKSEGSGVDSTSPIQVVAGNMSRWVLMFAIGMGSLGLVSLYLGLLVVASALISIVLVSITLYAFLRLWPEDEKANSAVKSISQIQTEPRPRAMVQTVRLDGPPKARFVMAIRDMVRRQESIQISQQGAEMFAKTIRYILRSQR